MARTITNTLHSTKHAKQQDVTDIYTNNIFYTLCIQNLVKCKLTGLESILFSFSVLAVHVFFSFLF